MLEALREVTRVIVVQIRVGSAEQDGVLRHGEELAAGLAGGGVEEGDFAGAAADEQGGRCGEVAEDVGARAAFDEGADGFFVDEVGLDDAAIAKGSEGLPVVQEELQDGLPEGPVGAVLFVLAVEVPAADEAIEATGSEVLALGIEGDAKHGDFVAGVGGSNDAVGDIEEACGAVAAGGGE